MAPRRRSTVPPHARKRRAPVRRRSGVVLLEVLVALVLIATAGAAILALEIQTESAVHRARDAERRLDRAHAFFQAATLWSAAEFDLRLGTRAQGPYRLTIQRPSSTVYLLALADSATPDRPMLETAVYRPADSTMFGAPAPRGP